MEYQCEMGLPSTEELIPLTQSLISPQLALAFGITFMDLNSTTCGKEDSLEAMNLRLFSGRSTDMENGKVKRGDSLVREEVNSGSKEENGDETGVSRAVKRPRLVWTPQLHKRFVDVIEHLGIDKAVPKTIMEMMNVEGLTRENVASHLQKYRLYLRRMEGLANEGHSTPRRAPTLFDSDGFGSISTPMPMALPRSQSDGRSLPLMPFSMAGPSPGPYGGGFGHLGLGLGLPMGGNSASPGLNCGFESGAYGMFWNRQRG